MPKKTYTQINSITLAAASSSVTFASIPQNYRDLILTVDGTSTLLTNVYIRFNSDSGTSYSYVYAWGNGSSTESAASNLSSISQLGLGPTKSNSLLQIMDYSATDKHKACLVRANVGLSFIQMAAERWANTSAITTLQIFPAQGVINSGTTFTLYGIEA
jgi:hypothetical protein